ncbi:MAG: hypothetical protein ACI89X_002817 [Planctomycetota bacterium]|jgi:hypothetical protein
MASPPNKTADDYGVIAATDSSVGFALEELIACWTQAHEAMGRSDLQSVTSLLDLADVQLPVVGNGDDDTPAEALLRARAVTAYGLLQHAMKSGLKGINKEISQTNRGTRALRGYVKAAGRATGHLLKSV